MEATIWTERMLSALDNGVRGGKWFSLMDKVYRATDASGVAESRRSNGGGRSRWAERQAVWARAEGYLAELNKR